MVQRNRCVEDRFDTAVYTCLNDDHAACAETAITRECDVEVDYEEKMTKPRNGSDPRPYNALNSITLIQPPVETNASTDGALGSPVLDEPVGPSGIHSDDIPF